MVQKNEEQRTVHFDIHDGELLHYFHGHPQSKKCHQYEVKWLVKPGVRWSVLGIWRVILQG